MKFEDVIITLILVFGLLLILVTGVGLFCLLTEAASLVVG